MSDFRVFYESSNGDQWALGQREPDLPYVLHIANQPSGGARTEIEIASFLARGPAGPEHQALLKLIGTTWADQGLGQAARPAIRHSVIFTLKHGKGSPEEKDFLSSAMVLAAIPGVMRFERLVQVSPKNEFAYGFSMEFESQAAFEAYTSHPTHVTFVHDRWGPEVVKFLEIDYMPLS